MRRFTPLVAGLATSLIAALVLASPGLADTPPRQIALGISENYSWCVTKNLPDSCPKDSSNNPINVLQAVTKDELDGHQPAIWSLWSDWGDVGTSDGHTNTAPFPVAAIDALSAKGVVPQIYWEPLDPTFGGFDCPNWSLKTIFQGAHDAYIKAWAKAAAADKNTIILRFAHEMNGNWYVWGTQGQCGNTPKQFRKAWIHVWTIFHNAGATNVKFEYGVLGSKDVEADYPGNKYVSYLALTVLNWGSNHQVPWRSMVDASSGGMKTLRRLSTTKPIILAEVASGPDQNCDGCTKASWLSTGYPAVFDHANWGQIVAIVYLDIDLTGVGQPDWRLQTPPAALDAYNELLTNPDFQGTCC